MRTIYWIASLLSQQQPRSIFNLIRENVLGSGFGSSRLPVPRSADGERGRVILLARACPRLDSIYHRVCENVWEKIVKRGGGGQMHSADQTLDRSVFAISALSSELFSASVCVCVCTYARFLRRQRGGSWWVDRSASTEQWHFSNWPLLQRGWVSALPSARDANPSQHRHCAVWDSHGCCDGETPPC